MARYLYRDVTIPAGSQFEGTELNVSARRNSDMLLAKEVLISFGSESKSWFLEKVDPNGNRFVIHRSVDPATGLPAATTSTSAAIWEQDLNIILERGSQIQIRTTGATAEMHLHVKYEEIPSWP